MIPAAVSFCSMLENADKRYRYALYVLHDDITEKNQSRLIDLVKKYDATLEFINTKGRFKDLYKKYKRSAFSKEMFYKLVAASTFPQYDKIIITDVDVVFLGDISEEYINFDIYGGDKDYYVAGCLRHLEGYLEQCYRCAEDSIKRYLREIFAGYQIHNLKRIREDDVENKMVAYAYENINKMGNPEQETINDCCYPNIKVLPPNILVSTRRKFDVRKIEDMETKKYFKNAIKRPLQLHFAEKHLKAWDHVLAPKYDKWLEYLYKTTYYQDYLCNLQNAINMNDTLKKVFSVKIPFRDRYFSIYMSNPKAVRTSKTLLTK